MSNAHSCVKVLRHPSGLRQNHFNKSVQAEAVREYKRELTAPVAAAPYGSRKDVPELVTLAKHVNHGDNKVAETTVALAFGALELGVDIETVTKPFRVLDSMLRAQVGVAPHYSLEKMQEIETEMDATIDCLQMRYMGGDKSERTKREMLEQFEKYEKITRDIVTQLRRELYTGPRP